MRTKVWNVQLKPGQTIKSREGFSITNRSTVASAKITITSEPVAKPETIVDETQPTKST